MHKTVIGCLHRQLLYGKRSIKLLTFVRTMSVADSGKQFRNRLGMEKSPYLLQHANNPVDWFPWGQEAFDKAKQEDKLIFLSVGYSTCHWCHVMERESFQNQEIGRFLNDNFVCIKVDREERPDVDKVYMTFIQATVGSGGWPMSVWLTPDLKPIVGGTYFPPDDRYYGRPGFKSMLDKIVEQWQLQPQKIRTEGKKMLFGLMKHFNPESDTRPEMPDVEVTDKCYRLLERNYDKDNGGFGSAPKFPQPVNFSLMNRIYAQDPDSARGRGALRMCTHTLKRMAKGGIYDHIADGFHRYSTDNDWHVPHFEKMSYDQAQLAVSYAEAFQITKDPEFADVTRRILSYVNRDLSDKSGGFYSAEDADSYPTHDALEKKEGAFCVWTHDELCSLLNTPLEGRADNKTHADVFCQYFGVQPQGNVDPYKDPHDELKGQNVLIIKEDIQTTAENFGLTVENVSEILAKSKERLFDIRKGRPSAHLDNKMITAWNGLMVSAFAVAGRVLGESSYVERAQTAVQFIRENLYKPDPGTLLRSCYLSDDGQLAQIPTPIEGFVDDYAFLVRGLLDLYEASQDVSLLEWAEDLQSRMDKLFWDPAAGGYFLSGAGDTSIVLRLKDDQDGAEPSANSVAVNNLLRLSSLLDQPRLREQAGEVLAAFSDRLTSIPHALPEMVGGYLRYQSPPSQLVIVGEKSQADTKALQRCVSRQFLPNTVQILVDESSDAFFRERLPVLSSMEKKDGRATAYICQNFACSLPVNTPEELQQLLAQHK